MKPRLATRQFLPVLSGIAIAVAAISMAGQHDWWPVPLLAAIYLLVLAIALERTGL